MRVARKTNLLEPELWLVHGPQLRTLETLGIELRSLGHKVRVESDLGDALAAGPSVVLVDPAGWQAVCRRTLEDVERRPHAPPAVLFVGADPSVRYTAGPCCEWLPWPGDARAVSLAVRRALALRERFVRYWPAPLDPARPQELSRAARLLGDATGLQVRGDREGVLAQALRLRLVARLCPTLREYLDLVLRESGRPQEIELLASLFTVGETYFWRYAGQFQALQRVLLPALASDRDLTRHPVQIWCAGCATGEETYSVALACAEALGSRVPFHVVGTDINRASLTHAEAARYGERAVRNLPAALRERYLESVGDAWIVRPRLRQRVTFAFGNLGGPEWERWLEQQPPLDAVFCRNTLIYFDKATTGRIIDGFEAALRPGGGLFLGASETLGGARSGLQPVRSMGSFFYRRQVDPATPPVSPPAVRRETAAPGEDAADAAFRSGLEHLSAEEFAAARRLFEQCAAAAPEDARGHTGMAILLANEGREVEAEDYLERARGCRPDLAETHFLTGLLAERRGDEVAALHSYRQALELTPDFFMAHVNRAWILRRLGRTGRYLEELRAALGILRCERHVPLWATGGMGLQALLSLLGDLVEDEGDACDEH